jgi:hypothetical protein
MAGDESEMNVSKSATPLQINPLQLGKILKLTFQPEESVP